MPIADFFDKTHPIGKLCDLPKNEEPIELSDQLEWGTLDPSDQDQVRKVVQFLNQHYVSDNNGEFRLKYTEQFLSWYLQSQNSCCNVLLIHKGLRVVVGCIFGSFSTLTLGSSQSRVCETNFMCLNKNLRRKGYAEKLVMEISRRSVLLGIDVAFYTSARKVYTPVTSVQYSHRPLRYRQLVKLGFCSQEPEHTLRLKEKLYRITDEKPDASFVPMKPEHLASAHQLFNQYMDRYTIRPQMTLEEFAHEFNNSVISTFVTLDESKVTDMISFYQLNSMVLSQPGEEVKTGYLYYYTAMNHSITWLFRNLLVAVKDREFDVFNILDLMENQELIDTNMFLKGTGKLQYYMYNWKLLPIKPNQLGKLLV